MDKHYNKLYEKYPDLLYYIMRPIECDIGWYSIISNVCVNLTKYNNTNGTKIGFKQIKEKLGYLTIYLNNHEHIKALDIVQDAYSKSKTTCEVCGTYGNLVDIDGCLQVLCFKHIVLTYVKQVLRRFKI